MKRSIFAICIFSILILSGCQKYDNISKDGTNYPPISPLPSRNEIEITLYYPNDDFNKLVEEERTVNKDHKEIEEIILDELLKGTDKRGLGNIIPNGVRLISMDIIENIAYVNFSNELINRNLSETKEGLILYSIVNSLTELETIEKVQLMIEGEIPEVFYNYYTIKEPLEFSKLIVNEKYTSPINVINEYYDSLIGEDFDKTISLIHLKQGEKITYTTLKSYLETSYGSIANYEIKDYEIDRYGNNIKLKVDALTQYKQGIIREQTRDYQLIYIKGSFKLVNILN